MDVIRADRQGKGSQVDDEANAGSRAKRTTVDCQETQGSEPEANAAPERNKEQLSSKRQRTGRVQKRKSPPSESGGGGPSKEQNE